jgi:Eukaryotic-type carbonic anhydrase
MHLVHWKTSYGNIANAKSHPDGLAVLAVLFNAESTSNGEEEMEVIRMMHVIGC